MILTQEQQEAAAGLYDLLELSSGFAAEPIRYRIKGYAGTGKTVVVAHLAKVLQHKYQVYMTAPTNQAVQVLQGKMSGIKAQYMTIHKLFGFGMRVDHEKGQEVISANSGSGALAAGNKSYKDQPVLIFIDEASMVTSDFKAVIDKVQAHVVIVGDPGQLPPVGESNSPLFDMDVDGEYTLKTVLRQGEGSAVLDMATSIRNGNPDAFFHANGHDIIRGYSLHTISHIFDTDDPFNARLCCFTNATRTSMNARIRAFLGINSRLPVKGEFLIVMSPYFSAYDVSYDVLGEHLHPVDPLEQKAYWKRRRELKEKAQAAYRDGDPAASTMYRIFKQTDNRFRRMTLYTSEMLQVTGEGFDTIVNIDIDDLESNNPVFEGLHIPAMNLAVSTVTGKTSINDLICMTEDTRERLVSLKKRVAVEAARIKAKRKTLSSTSKGGINLTQELRDLWKSYFEVKRHFCDVDFAYASSTHKAQGSGFKNVVIHPEVAEAPHKQQMLYTAVTRTIETLYVI
jgi:hypothetical protein